MAWALPLDLCHTFHLLYWRLFFLQLPLMAS